MNSRLSTSKRILLIVAIVVSIFVGGTFLLLIGEYVIGNVVTDAQLSKEMQSIVHSLPANYHKIHQNYSPKGLDNKAILKADFTVSGTRQAVFSQVAKSLGLTSTSSDNQELKGVSSPQYKNTFWLTISPEDSVTTEFNLCSNAETDAALHACLNNTPGHGANLSATTMELEIIAN